MIRGIERLWAETLGDPAVCLAVLDGPVDLSHPCFEGAAITSVGGDGSNRGDGPAARHGTLVASAIFGQHGSPVAGIAPRCRGIAIEIFRDAPGDGVAPCSQIDLARGITAAVEAGAHVVNISGGQLEPSGEPSHFLARAVQLCAERGVLIVAATGNDGCACLHVPAAAPSVIAVGAMDANGDPLPSSNWGPAYRTNGVLAPGENIRGALPGGGVQSATGTSIATPIVAGVAALLLCLQRKLGQPQDADDVRAAILTSATNATDDTLVDRPELLAGRLDIEGATLRIQREATMADSSHNDSTPLPNQTAAIEDGGGVATAVGPSTCGCGKPGCSGGCNGSTQQVFAIGQLGYDFGTEARRDSIAQHMGGDPYNPELLLAHLDKHPWDAAAINWTLGLDAVRIYVVEGKGAFADEVYQRLREFMRGQLKEGIERISIPGVLHGKRTLLSGEVVPVIIPELRGMYSWTTTALVQAVAGPAPGKGAKDREGYDAKASGVRNFLERVYHELRNLGVTAEERAINYAAANAFAVNQIFEAALNDRMELDTIECERSPICRPDSDCWDVKLTFFDPDKILQRARRTYRFTVDVSDVVPVTVGPVRSWSVR